MKILLISAYFPPDTGSASHLFYELGKALSDQGHKITVITGIPSYHVQGPLDRYKGKNWIRENVNGMDVLRVALPQLPRQLMVARALWQFSGAFAFLFAGLKVARQDITFVYYPPQPLGLTGWALKKLSRIPVVLNVQDLFPQSIIDLGLLKNPWIIRIFETMERFIYRQADVITVHSEGNRQYVINKGASVEKVIVIPNWVDTDFIRPSERINEFRREHGLVDAFIVSFAGVLGYSQDIDVILQAAKLTEEQQIFWLIVGDGVEKARLQLKAKEMELKNVKFLPMQPREKYPSILHASDIGLVTLYADVKTPVVPSKIQSIMAAGRPVVASLSLSGDAPKLISEAGCGLCVPPENPQALAGAILTLYRDPALREEMGRNGRRYVEEDLSLEACTKRYEELIKKVKGEKLGTGSDFLKGN